jgi:hypothetical protein
MTGNSRFAIRRGEVIELEEGAVELADDVAQPMPDPRRIEDLIGSGEFESKRSRRGEGLWVAMVRTVPLTGVDSQKVVQNCRRSREQSGELGGQSQQTLFVGRLDPYALDASIT